MRTMKISPIVPSRMPKTLDDTLKNTVEMIARPITIRNPRSDSRLINAAPS